MVEFPGLMKGTVVVHCTQQVERTLQVPLPRSVQHSHHSIPLLLHLHKMSGLFGKFLLTSYFLFLLELKVNYSPIHFFTYFKLPQTPRTDLFEAQLYFSRIWFLTNTADSQQSVVMVYCIKKSYAITWKAFCLLMINHRTYMLTVMDWLGLSVKIKLV